MASITSFTSLSLNFAENGIEIVLSEINEAFGKSSFLNPKVFL